MSQPPYQPYQPQPPFQPQQPYQYGPPSPYRKRSSGTAIALIVIGIVLFCVLLMCGGLLAVVGLGAKGISDAVDDYEAHQDRVGGPRHPVGVDEGAAFTIDGIDYAAGWRLARTDDVRHTHVVEGLRGTNNRDDADGHYANLDFVFLIGTEEVGEIDCRSQSEIADGHSQTLDCTSYGDFRGDWKDIEVSAAW